MLLVVASLRDKVSSPLITFIVDNYRRFVLSRFSSYWTRIIIHASGLKRGGRWNGNEKLFLGGKSKGDQRGRSKRALPRVIESRSYPLVQVSHSSRRYHAITAATAATSGISVSISKEAVPSCARLCALARLI